MTRTKKLTNLMKALEELIVQGVKILQNTTINRFQALEKHFKTD